MGGNEMQIWGCSRRATSSIERNKVKNTRDNAQRRHRTVVQRRDLLQELAHFGVTFVAVPATAQANVNHPNKRYLMCTDQGVMHHHTHLIRCSGGSALGTAKVAAIGFGVCQKCDKVADANNINCGYNSFRIMKRNSKRHVATVTAPIHNHTAAVKVVLALDPVQKASNISHLQ